MPLSSPLTVEPGGQLELSSPPAASLMECVGTVSADLAAVRTALAEHGLAISGNGTDPWRTPAGSCTSRATTPWRPASTARARQAGR